MGRTCALVRIQPKFLTRPEVRAKEAQSPTIATTVQTAGVLHQFKTVLEGALRLTTPIRLHMACTIPVGLRLLVQAPT